MTKQLPASAQGAHPEPHRAAGPLAIARAPAFSETVAPANDAFEHEADRIADAVLQGRRWHRPWQGGWSAAASAPDGKGAPIRRSPKAGTEGPASVAPEPAAAATPAPALLLVADDAEVARGQMRKGEFMTALLDHPNADVARHAASLLDHVGRR